MTVAVKSHIVSKIPETSEEILTAGLFARISANRLFSPFGDETSRKEHVETPFV